MNKNVYTLLCARYLKKYTTIIILYNYIYDVTASCWTSGSV